MIRPKLTSCLLILSAASIVQMMGQTPPRPPEQAPLAPTATPALSTQVKKTVVYLRTDCLHDFSAELGSLTREKLIHLPLPQEALVVRQLVDTTVKLKSVRVSMSKLSAEDTNYLMHPNPLTDDPEQLAVEGAWRAGILLKMTAITSADAQLMTPLEYDAFPTEQHLGTGFFVMMPADLSKLSIANKPGEALGYTYLVTNRHVVQPGIDTGKPCAVPLRSFVISNHKKDSNHPSVYAETARSDGALQWTFSTDDSVDLAVAPINFSSDEYDFLRIPTTEFLTRSEMEMKKAVEGDPVFFSGLFIQFYDQKIQLLDPIVRSGTLAMVPESLLPTTMQRRPGHVFLTDAHAFGGNSGSPVFVDTVRFTGGIGLSFKFLGVVSGEVFENSDLTFTVTTSVAGNVAANSDVSMVVPGWQILEILDQPDLKKKRDDALAIFLKQQSTDPIVTKH